MKKLIYSSRVTTRNRKITGYSAVNYSPLEWIWEANRNCVEIRRKFPTYSQSFRIFRISGFGMFPSQKKSKIGETYVNDLNKKLSLPTVYDSRYLSASLSTIKEPHYPYTCKRVKQTFWKCSWKEGEGVLLSWRRYVCLRSPLHILHAIRSLQDSWYRAPFHVTSRRSSYRRKRI